MKTQKLIILFILLISINLQVFSQKKYKEKNFYGHWYCYANQENNQNYTIEVYWNKNNTTNVTFHNSDGTKYKTTTKWKYIDNMYYETYEDNTDGKAEIEWINKNKFALTIIENQDTENYKGIKRIYEKQKD